MTGPDPGLDALAASARKSLHWATFLLAAMLLILVIDLQIKRAIGRQAVSVGKMLSDSAALNYQTDRLIADVRKGGRDGPGAADPPADDGDNPVRGGGDHVDGSTGMAAGGDPPGGPAPGTAPRRPPRPRVRAPRDG